MSAKDEYIFVLWGKGFDEIAATVFVVGLRQRGHLVKVVGVGSSKPKGTYGLVLLPDMGLDEALVLANQCKCIIVPCDNRYWSQLQNDPRLLELISRSIQNRTRLICDGGKSGKLEITMDRNCPAQQTVCYRITEDLSSFIHALVNIVEQI